MLLNYHTILFIMGLLATTGVNPMTDSDRKELLGEVDRLMGEVSRIHELLQVQKVVETLPQDAVEETQEEIQEIAKPRKKREVVRYMRNFSVWLDYINRLMYNAELRQIGDSYQVSSTNGIIAEWDGRRGYVNERRSQDWLWSQLASYNRTVDDHPKSRRGLRI